MEYIKVFKPNFAIILMGIREYLHELFSRPGLQNLTGERKRRAEHARLYVDHMSNSTSEYKSLLVIKEEEIDDANLGRAQAEGKLEAVRLKVSGQKETIKKQGVIIRNGSRERDAIIERGKKAVANALMNYDLQVNNNGIVLALNRHIANNLGYKGAEEFAFIGHNCGVLIEGGLGKINQFLKLRERYGEDTAKKVKHWNFYKEDGKKRKVKPLAVNQVYLSGDKIGGVDFYGIRLDIAPLWKQTLINLTDMVRAKGKRAEGLEGVVELGPTS